MPDDNVRRAHAIDMEMCPAEGRDGCIMHILLLDEDHEVFAAATVDESMARSIAKFVQGALQKNAV